MSLFVQRIRTSITVIFLLFIGAMSFANKDIFKNPVNNFIHGKVGFRKMTKAIASGYVSNQLIFKNSFINLNFFTRSLWKLIKL